MPSIMHHTKKCKARANKSPPMFLRCMLSVSISGLMFTNKFLVEAQLIVLVRQKLGIILNA